MTTPKGYPGSGKILKVTNGDIACYLEIENAGEKTELKANFDVCKDPEKIKGNVYRFQYHSSHVMSASCEGDPNCKKYDQVWIVVNLHKPEP